MAGAATLLGGPATRTLVGPREACQLAAVTRDELHRRVDELPDFSLETVALWLERVRDPMIARLDTAPPDDEPYTNEERAADERAREAFERGEGMPLEQLMAELDEAD